jgi:predicted AAA+ superfamily ATPase
MSINIHNWFWRRKSLADFVVDEVWKSPTWEIELNNIHDMQDLTIYCTGSTSALIKGQGGNLTGRQIITTLYPLSFNEAMRQNNPLCLVGCASSNGFSNDQA